MEEKEAKNGRIMIVLDNNEVIATFNNIEKAEKELLILMHEYGYNTQDEITHAIESGAIIIYRAVALDVEPTIQFKIS